MVTATVLQVEGSLSTEFHQQLWSIKEFIHWKDPSLRRTREVDLGDLKTRDILQYTKEDIVSFEQNNWLKRIKNRINIRPHTTDKDEKLLKIVTALDKDRVLLNKNNYIFNNNTTKQEDSYIMDYIHGSSFIFGNTRKSLKKEPDDICYFCDRDRDSAEHQIFFCKELYEEDPRRDWENVDATNYLEQILVPKSKSTQIEFIERVKFLTSKHLGTENPYLDGQ